MQGAAHWCARSHSRPTIWRATAPPTAPAVHRARKGRASRSPLVLPMDPEAASQSRCRERHRTKVGSSAEVAQVGTISSNGDATIGRSRRRCRGFGNEGVITVEEEVAEVEYRRGYCSSTAAPPPSPSSMTTEKMHCELEDAYILLHEKSSPACRRRLRCSKWWRKPPSRC